MKTAKYEGGLIIGDESYFNQVKSNPYVKELMFEGHINSELDYEVLEIMEDGYKMTLALLHFYNDRKRMNFNLSKGKLSYYNDIEIIENQLGCDTASFVIIGKNATEILTTADGYFGHVFRTSEGEIIITLYVDGDAISAKYLQENIEFALGL